MTSQSALISSEHRHRSLVDLLPDGLFIQCDGIVMYANASLANMLGFATPEEFIGKHVLDLFHPNSHDLVKQRIAQLNSGIEKLPAIEEQLIRIDGSPLDAEVRAVRTTWNDRSSVQVIARDISEKKKAEADRARLEEQLRLLQKIETIGTMAAGIAHDFNNLLVPIIGYSELIASEELPGKFSSEYLQEVLKAAYRAKGLVAQILAFSRQETGERKPIQIDAVITEVITLLRQSTAPNIRFTHLLSDKVVPVMADSTQMVQVLMNICVNATQAMPDGGEITVKSTPWDSGSLSCRNCKRKLHGKMVHVEITDTGCGMDEATLKRIFDPFFTTKGVGKGAGLGLAVTHGIVTQHSGHICAESKLGEGSTFHLFLPIARAIVSGSNIEPLQTVQRWNESILIVDDEPAVANSHAASLNNLGYKVTVAYEPVTALDLFRQDPGGFDIVLLDQRMPDMSGDQLAVELLRIRPDLPIVVCSGFSDSLSPRSAHDLGIREMIMKPVVASELNRALRAALGARHSITVS
jgi:PAS domain S-box-containing protein